MRIALQFGEGLLKHIRAGVPPFWASRRSYPVTFEPAGFHWKLMWVSVVVRPLAGTTGEVGGGHCPLRMGARMTRTENNRSLELVPRRLAVIIEASSAELERGYSVGASAAIACERRWRPRTIARAPGSGPASPRESDRGTRRAPVSRSCRCD